MKKVIIFGVVLALFSTILVSCDKDEDQTTDTKQIVIDKTWELTSVETEKEDATFTAYVDLLMAVGTLQYDFKEDGTSTETIVSAFGTDSEAGTWSISSDMKTLTIDSVDITISSCTETTLKLTGDGVLEFVGAEGSFDTGAITMTFTAQ
jgi:hypothetical protein